MASPQVRDLLQGDGATLLADLPDDGLGNIGLIEVKLVRQAMEQRVWEVKAAQVWQIQDGQWSDRTYWLIWARNSWTGEEEYFPSNAAVDARVQRLVRVGFRRWDVEHAWRVAKSEWGFTPDEGRHYMAMMRHQVLCLPMLSFVAGSTQRLIHVPDDVVSYGRLPGATVDEAEDLRPKGLEVAEAGPDRRLQIRDRVEQPVVRRPPPQLLPETLDDVQGGA